MSRLATIVPTVRMATWIKWTNKNWQLIATTARSKWVSRRQGPYNELPHAPIHLKTICSWNWIISPGVHKNPEYSSCHHLAEKEPIKLIKVVCWPALKISGPSKRASFWGPYSCYILLYRFFHPSIGGSKILRVGSFDAEWMMGLISRYPFWLQTTECFGRCWYRGHYITNPGNALRKSFKNTFALIVSSNNSFFVCIYTFLWEKHCENSQNLLT